MKTKVEPRRVRDVMQPAVVRLMRDQSLREVARVLMNHGVSGAPVCDTEGHVVGMFTKTDLIEGLARDELDQGVERAMTRGAVCISADEPLERAISLMVFDRIHRVIVLDEDSRLAGIITPMDVLSELAVFGRPVVRPHVGRNRRPTPRASRHGRAGRASARKRGRIF
jgi:predicted transcriptional regulator